MSALQPARGTHDILGEEQRRFYHVVTTARQIASRYGFDEWITPVFEDTRVFARSLGDTSDIVSKEMYTFEDRGGDSITLRPEGTAAICRALVSNGLTQSLPQKVFYAGPMFRYERPQKGRYRQFHQIGAELIGAAEPLADAEMISMGWDILSALGISGHTVLELNTLGDAPSRKNWRDALVDYFRQVRDQLSEDSQLRLERNPLRILDSKDPADRALMAEVPLIGRYLSEEAARFWDELRRLLDKFNVPFRENPKIVRGLDYYNHTAFEFVTESLGSQGTVMAGGRYDELVSEMGGPRTPAIGWAAGVERLSMLLQAPPAPERVIALIPMAEPLTDRAIGIMQTLRAGGLRVEMAYRGNFRKRMERANRMGACCALILGEEELTREAVQFKDFASGQQEEIKLPDLMSHIRRFMEAQP